MAIYAIGDIQGCFVQLQQLLEKIHFNPAHDQLWLTGDLINRGPDSLGVLRWAKALGDKVICVLGNHDLHLLAVASGAVSITSNDTFHDVLTAPDVAELMDWLRQLPLLHYDAASHYLLVHAGIAPMWDLAQAQSYAHEIETLLRAPDYIQLLKHMYKRSPTEWSPTLHGWDRYRIIINYFTRLRYVDTHGRLHFHYKGEENDSPADHIPWFRLPRQLDPKIKIIFGHWAALQGKASFPNIFPLDTGCCWGNCLTAMRLDDQTRYQVACPPAAVIFK